MHIDVYAYKGKYAHMYMYNYIKLYIYLQFLYRSFKLFFPLHLKSNTMIAATKSLAH